MLLFMAWKANHSQLTELPLMVKKFTFQRNVKEFLSLFSDVHQIRYDLGQKPFKVILSRYLNIFRF